MDIFSLLGSKASMAIIGVVMVGLTWGGMKFEIWRLEGKLLKAKAEASDFETRNRTCQVDISTLRLSFFTQNERIDRMKEDATEISRVASQAALQEIASPADLEKIKRSPPGHGEMNRFMVDLLMEGS